MRGIAVVLVLCLVSCAFAAVCNNGVVSSDSTGCVCASGFNGADSCAASVLATAAQQPGATCGSKQLSQTEATWFPTLTPPTNDVLNGPVRFVGNTLYAQIMGNYVAARQYTELTFVPRADQVNVTAPCHVGTHSSYWSQVADVTSCNDTFFLQLPWANHRDCGFGNNTAKSDNDYLFITGYMYIRYSDALGSIDGFNLTRSTKVPFSVSVKFQRHVTVQLQALNVTSDVKYGMALTEDTYDPETGILTLELTSIINWPNQFYTGDGLPLYNPNQVLPQPVGYQTGKLCASATSCADVSDQDTTVSVYPVMVSCSPDQEKSLCTQTFTLKSKLDQANPNNCTYDGRYDIIAPLYTCRQVAGGNARPECTSANINITWFIVDSNVCGQIGVTPSVSGQLFAFDPEVTSNFRASIATLSKTNFQLGKYANFYAKIDSDDNTIGIQFREISFTQQGQSNWVRLYNSSGWDSDNTLQSTYPSTPALIGGYVNHTAKFFKVYFHSSIFKVNPNSQVIYTFRATIDISFEGNDHFLQPMDGRKRNMETRTIETTWEQAVTTAETNVFMRAPASPKSPVAVQVAPVQDQGVSSVTFIASVVGAVAGTMIIVFVVVGFALRARSQSKDEPNSSLIAASAAAAEVANRA